MPVRLVPDPSKIDPALPVAIDGCAGVYHPASSDRAALLIGPIGYEALCARETGRMIGENLAAAHVACLRLDLPGQGNSLDVTGNDPFAAWRKSARQGIDFLRRQGANDIAILGFGAAAFLALELEQQFDDIGCMVLLAPVTSGRRYVSELRAWARLMASRSIADASLDEARSGEASLAGYVFEASLMSQLAALDFSKADAPRKRTLVVFRDGHPSDAALVQRWSSGAVSTMSFEGYEQIMTDPTTGHLAGANVARRVANWVAGSAIHLRVQPAGDAEPQLLKGEGFAEERVAFGPGKNLHGVFCRPEDWRRERGALLIATGGRNHHEGWARGNVEIARELALRGIATFRFDLASVGDSAPAGVNAREVLYSQEAQGDLRAAIDWLEWRGAARIVLMGHCSGAYGALHLALEDRRAATLVLVNILRFVWNPNESVAEALQNVVGSEQLYAGAMRDPEVWRKLMRGEIDPRIAFRKVSRRLTTSLLQRTAPLAAGLTWESTVFNNTHAMMRRLAARGTRVTFVCSEGDASQDLVQTVFGRDLRWLARYPLAGFRMLERSDHNLTSRSSRDRLFSIAESCFPLAESDGEVIHAA